jgi:hypothetical protein
MIRGLYPNFAVISRPPTGRTVSLGIVGTADVIPTDVVLIPTPDIFKWLPIGAKDLKVTVSQKFEDLPSSSLTFIAQADDKFTLVNLFKIGAEFTMFSIGWRIDSLNFVEVPYSENPSRIMGVTVGLVGAYKNYLDKKIPLLNAPNRPLNFDPDCASTTTKLPKRNTKTTCQNIATRAGTAFTGPGLWSFDIPTETTPEDSVTLKEKLEAFKLINGCFIYYGEAKQITAKPLDAVDVWEINDTTVIANTIDTPIQGFIPEYNQKVQPTYKLPQVLSKPLPGVKGLPPAITIKDEPEPVNVVYYYPKSKLEGAFSQTEQMLDEERRQSESKLWRRKPSVTFKKVSGDLNPSKAPGGGKAGDVRLNHDQSGPKLVKIEEWVKDGVTLRMTTTEYGHAFSGSNLASWSNSKKGWVMKKTSGGWTKVKEVTETKEFEPRWGFYIGSVTRGWDLFRFRQESDGLPETAVAAHLQGNRDINSTNIGPLLSEVSVDDDTFAALDPSVFSGFVGQVAGLYRFQKSTVSEREIVVLEALRKYYRDSEIPFAFDAPEKVCLPNGQSTYLTRLTDPGAAPEYFVSRNIKYSASYKETSNPEYSLQNKINDALQLTDEERSDRAVTPKLTAGANTITDISVVIDSTSPGEPDSYTVYESTYSGSGAGFNRSAQTTTFSRNEGRPSTSNDRLANLWVQDEEQQTADTKRSIKESPEFTTYITSPGGPPSNLVGGSLSFPEAETLQQAQTAALTKLKLDNFNALGTKQITLRFTEETFRIKEGDKVRLTLNGWRGMYRVMAKETSVEVQGNYLDKLVLTSPGVTLTLAPEPKVAISVQRERAQKETQTREDTIKNSQFIVLNDLGAESSMFADRFS